MSTLQSIKMVNGRATPLRGANIDTDRIIPARYLKVTKFDTLGEFAFYDERFDGDGNRLEHPLNDERYAGSNILIVQSNFGSGSSREHAPQALMRHGFKAFIGESFAEIFFGNCLMLGLPAVTLTGDEIHRLLDMVEQNPQIELSVDVVAKQVRCGEDTFDASLTDSSQQSLLSGNWNSTNMLLSNTAAIKQVAGTLPYLNNFASNG